MNFSRARQLIEDEPAEAPEYYTAELELALLPRQLLACNRTKCVVSLENEPLILMKKVPRLGVQVLHFCNQRGDQPGPRVWSRPRCQQLEQSLRLLAWPDDWRRTRRLGLQELFLEEE